MTDIIKLADGTHIRLTQDAYLDNGPNGEAVYKASGYLSTEKEGDETGPTVMVFWDTDGTAEDSADDCDWDNPSSARHYSIGNLQLA